MSSLRFAPAGPLGRRGPARPVTGKGTFGTCVVRGEVRSPDHQRQGWVLPEPANGGEDVRRPVSPLGSGGQQPPCWSRDRCLYRDDANKARKASPPRFSAAFAFPAVSIVAVGRCWSGVTEVETPRDRSDRSSGSGEPAPSDLPSVGPTNWAGGWWGLPLRSMRVELSTELIMPESAAAPGNAGNDAAGVQHPQSQQSGRRSPHDMCRFGHGHR